MTDKVRLDILVQERAGVSRSKARGLIHTGNVVDSGGEPLRKPGQLIDRETAIAIKAAHKYVSRGGEKLEAGLREFGLNVQGLVALDAGASTGGFTDCLLQHGAAKVYAIDVGYGQIDWSLRQNDRVVVIERTNVRTLDPALIHDPIEFFSADCSFISLKLVLPGIIPVLDARAEGLVLVKPQFEAGPERVGKGGVVRDPTVHDAVLADIENAAVELGFDVRGVVPSPLLGPAGNREFLMQLYWSKTA